MLTVKQDGIIFISIIAQLSGEKIEVKFEVYINKSSVADLNTGKEKLEDILILHLVGGNFDS